MRPLFTSLMISSLLLAAPAFAVDLPVNSPDHPAFQNLRKEVQQNDGARKTNDLAAAMSNGGLGTSCNPVVWASLVQKARLAAKKDVQLASAVNNRVPPQSSCTDAVNRSAFVQKARDSTKALSDGLMSAVASLLGLSPAQVAAITNSLNLNVAKIASGALDSAINLNCQKADNLTAQIVGGVNQQVGTDALNGSTAADLVAAFNPPKTPSGGGVVGTGPAPTKPTNNPPLPPPERAPLPSNAPASVAPQSNTTPVTPPAAAPAAPGNLYK